MRSYAWIIYIFPSCVASTREREEQQKQPKKNTKLQQSYIFIARGDKQKVLNSFSISTHDINPANDSHNTFSIQLNTFENLIINLFILSFVPIHLTFSLFAWKIFSSNFFFALFWLLPKSISFCLFFFASKARFLRYYYHEIYMYVVLIFLASPSNLRKTSNLYLCYYKNSRLAHKNIYNI